MLVIQSWIRINERLATSDNPHIVSLFEQRSGNNPEDFYRAVNASYPKFFKMDSLSKWGWIGAESLLNRHISSLQNNIDTTKAAVVLTTSHGCLETDKKYFQTTAGIPSPALFVYTLPNIMLGEISIRHGFKGEQACFVAPGFSGAQLFLYVKDLLENRQMDACLCGWVDVSGENPDVCMFWVAKEGRGLVFSADTLDGIYQAINL
jgi:3-oxoacyl-(acyl-carrier-protein) synthase